MAHDMIIAFLCWLLDNNKNFFLLIFFRCNESQTLLMFTILSNSFLNFYGKFNLKIQVVKKKSPQNMVVIFMKKNQKIVQLYKKTKIKHNYYLRSLQMHLNVHSMLSERLS